MGQRRLGGLQGAVACGLALGWFAMMLAPMGATSAVTLSESPWGAARTSFFLVLAVTAGLTCVPRLAKALLGRAAMLGAAGASCAVGLANWALCLGGHAYVWLLVCTFASSGAVAALLQLAWSERLHTCVLDGRRVAVASAVAIVTYVALAVPPTVLRQPLDSLLPLAALALLPSKRPDAVGAPEAPTRPTPWSCRQRVAVMLVLASGCVFNGMAETYAFILPGTMALGSALGVVIAGLAAWRLRGAMCGRTLAGCALAIALSTFVQGLMSLGGVGQVMLDRGFASPFHVVVFAAEYVTLAIALTHAHAPADPGTTQASWTDPAAANMGIAAGTLLGMSAGNAAAATMLALALALVATLLLGMQLGRDEAPATEEPAPEARGSIAHAGVRRLAEEARPSQREEDVLELWATGHQIDYVAEHLCISRNTAKTHVRHIYAKAGVTSREELLQRLEREG